MTVDRDRVEGWDRTNPQETTWAPWATKDDGTVNNVNHIKRTEGIRRKRSVNRRKER